MGTRSNHYFIIDNFNWKSGKGINLNEIIDFINSYDDLFYNSINDYTTIFNNKLVIVASLKNVCLEPYSDLADNIYEKFSCDISFVQKCDEYDLVNHKYYHGIDWDKKNEVEDDFELFVHNNKMTDSPILESKELYDFISSIQGLSEDELQIRSLKYFKDK
jgi:hypothetical protein